MACPVEKEDLGKLSTGQLYAQLKRLLPWKKETCAWPRPAASGTAASPVASVIAVRKSAV